jgi:hypothetical protein
MAAHTTDTLFRVESYRQQYTITMSGKYRQGRISFEETSPQDIVLAVEPMTIEGSTGIATIRLRGKSMDIDFITPDQSSLRFGARTAKDGRITITSTSPHGTDTIALHPDGTIDASSAAQVHQAPFGDEFLPLMRGLQVLRKPLTVLTSNPDPPITVFDANTGGGPKTRSQCNTDYVNAMKKAGGDALTGAATAVVSGLAGPWGLLAGLVILAGTYLGASSAEDTAGDALEACLAQAPD